MAPTRAFAVDATTGRRMAFASAGLTLVATILLIVFIVEFRLNNAANFNCLSNNEINTSCIRAAVDATHSLLPLELGFNILEALASIALIPAIILTDIFEAFGKPSNVMLPAFYAAVAIRLYELIARAGLTTQGYHMASDYQLSDTNMRALIINYETVRSQGMWLFTLDYLFLGVGLVAAAFGTYSCKDTMPRCWGHFSLLTGLLSCLIFCASFATLADFSFIGRAIGIMRGLDGLILVPIWTATLACYLRRAADATDRTNW